MYVSMYVYVCKYICMIISQLYHVNITELPPLQVLPQHAALGRGCDTCHESHDGHMLNESQCDFILVIGK